MGTEEDPIQCNKCFTVNPEDSEYCTRCGSSLEEMDETISYSPEYGVPTRDIPRFNPGDDFGHRFRIIEEIGRGGMGRVYKAKDHQLNTTVALKVIRPKFSADKLFVKRLIRETLIARSISHENVIRIHDIGEIADVKYISMDYISGENLKELVRTSGILTIETAIRISKYICESLKAAHKKGIAHRDLKPQNIMVDKNGVAYTMDFGLARAVKSRERMIPGSIYGTPQYTSPEQARGEEADERSDIYSLGTIIYEMVTGEPLVKGKSKEDCLQSQIKDIPIQPSKINPRVPQSLDNIILKCLEKERDKRYQNIDEVLKDLNEYERIADPEAAKRKKRKWVVVSAFSALVIVIGLLISFQLGLFEPPLPTTEEGRISLAIINFENNTGDESLNHLRRTISSLITFDLVHSKYLRPITSDRLLDIYNKLGLMDATSYSREDLKKIAEESGADHILQGNIYKSEGRYQINTMLHETSTWTLMGTPTAEGDSIISIVDDLGIKIKSAMNLSARAIAADIDHDIGQITTESTEALNYYIKGIELYIESNFSESNRVLQKAIKLDPEFAMAYSRMALNHSYEGKLQKTKEKIDIALSFLDRISPREQHLIQAYKAHWIDNSPQEAKQIYEDLLRLYPDDIDGLEGLGSLYRNLEEWDLALRQFEKILEMDSKHIHANQNLYWVYTAKGLYDKAIEVLIKNQDNFPQKSFTQKTLSSLYTIQHNTELAHQHADAALSLDPDNIDNILNKGHIYLLSGNLKKAEEYYQKLREKEDTRSSLEGLFQGMANLYILKGEYQKGKTEVTQALHQSQDQEMDFFEIQFLLLDAKLSFRMKRFPEALASASLAKEKALKANLSWNTQLSLLLEGLVYLEMKNITEAKNISMELKEIIDKKGGRSDRRNYFLLRGKIYLQEELISQAIDLFEVACSLLPAQTHSQDEHAFFFYTIADAEELNGNIDSAQRHYAEITTLTTGRLQWGDIYAKSFFKLGKIYEQKGQKEKAIENYEKFLELWKDSEWGKEEVSKAERSLRSLR